MDVGSANSLKPEPEKFTGEHFLYKLVGIKGAVPYLTPHTYTVNDLLLSAKMAANSEGQPPRHPHLRHDQTGTRLIVKGKPFHMFSGELHNSSLSLTGYMDEVWPYMKKEGINTLLGSVSWEQIEP
ncbi:hypothetical protein FQN50_005009 [Emmonsiellopsis sp. PD_5]|nr:hypothetical protein FQN50_005009 [Emmonsiellopsis sp. PD_5]